VAWHESISGEVHGLWPSASGIVSPDGGHGLFQLTSSFPDQWQEPLVNAVYAISEFLGPAASYWVLHGESGQRLVKLVAATFNEGLAAAIKYHAEGNVDIGTTNDYGAVVLGIYNSLVATDQPE
jgi:hypothetical protein